MRCIFVGYCLTQKAYRFWNPVTRMVKISRDATFDEHYRLGTVPDGTTAPVFQPVDLTPIQTQEEPVLPSTETTQNSPNKTTNDLVETNVPVESTSQYEESIIHTNLKTVLEPPQQPQRRISSRGRIPIRE